MKKGLFLSVYLEDIKLVGKKQNNDPMWNVLIKQVDFGEPTSFFDHVYLGCSQRACNMSKDFVDMTELSSDPEFPQEQQKYDQALKKKLNISAWSYDIQGHAKNCVVRYCELANKNDSETLHSINFMSL